MALDYLDIQGNVTKAYATFGYIFARYVFYRVHDAEAGRRFLAALVQDDYITSAVPWDPEGSGEDLPPVTTNIAFTYAGLAALGTPGRSLQSFPAEFAMGMKPRAAILGDDRESAPDHWDPIWQEDDPVHIWIGIAGLAKGGRDALGAIEERYQQIERLVAASHGGVVRISRHRDETGDDRPYQEASAVFDEFGQPTPKEHFGYVDGISDPYFEDRDDRPEHVLGMGKPTGKDPRTLSGWAPLATGEFILGYRDEAFEYPLAPYPRLLSRNGTFMVYRKLHENVGLFEEYIERVGRQLPGGKEELAAKFAGRWRNGAPLTTFRDKDSANVFAERLAKARLQNSRERAELERELVAFDYSNDLDGGGCPRGAHIRRANPRGALEFGVDGAFQVRGALVDRRRIARRGLPYGKALDRTRSDGNHGIIFMVINASIARQFEFVQQQWINYGNDFRLANAKDALIGNHSIDPTTMQPNGTAIFEAEPGRAPFFASGIPRLVETRGGDYFFVPSLTALRMIAQGILDPT